MRKRLVAAATGAVLLAAGVGTGLFGLFLVMYEGDSGGGNTWVSVGHHKVDADLFGAITLTLSLIAIFLFGVLRKRDRRRARRS